MVVFGPSEPFFRNLLDGANCQGAIGMRNLKPPLAMAVQQRGSRRSDPGREPHRIGTLPICTEDCAIGRINSYDDAPVVASFVQTNVYYSAGSQFLVLFAYGGLTRINELRPGWVYDIHRDDTT